MTIDAGEFLDKLIPVWRRMLPPNVSPRYFDGFVRRNRSALEAMLGEWLERRAQKKAAASSHELPPDLWTRAQRTRANLEAMRIVASRAPSEMTAEERRTVLTYSGWGGLSIEDNQANFPKDLVPETFGLIHEYYTPTVVAEAIAEVVCPLLAQLAGNDGTVRALEPSAGIGRLVRAMGPPRCIFPTPEVKRVQWTTVEFSLVSSRMLEVTFPASTHFHMPFERWIRLHGARHTGTINLILSNPPYGDRGEFALEDTDAFYREKTAYAYFMRRALDLLVPGGLGVFLVPAGFLSGVSNRAIREKLLRRHHLAGAYRLPSHTKNRREFVPGANVVMDVLFWRSRGGELAEVDADDQFILDGNYFTEFPQHLLGVEQGTFSGDDEAGTATTWRYQVNGEFAGLPQLAERPLCTACVLGPIVRRESPQYQALARAEEGLPDDIGEDVRGALLLGRRVGRYLAALGADEAERAAQLWPELHAALESFSASFGNPWRHKLLRELADRRELVAAQQILGAFTKTGELVAALEAPPVVERKYTGRPDDVIAQAEQLFRQQRALSIGQLEAFHKQIGGELGRAQIVDTLLSAEWNLDGDAWDQLLPKDAYLTGNQLWDRYDRAAARAARGDEQAKIQARRLLDAIKPAVFEDIQDINPQNVYDDLELLAGWLSATLNSKYGPVRLERKDGFVQAVGVDYVDSKNTVGLSPETLAFLGYYNHDPALFQPPREKRDRNEPPPSKEERQENKKRLAERRMELANQWAKSFRDWLAADDARKDRFVHAYNRATRGRIVPTFTPEPLEIARWGAQAPKLKAHQITGARRVLAARGGLVAFDVGVGKTYTALAIIARARQEGWVRRPVILVPGSLVWKWHDDILCTLPDYRVAVIGSKRKRISRGARKGILTSETDTPQERAAKWIALQSGQVDVVVLSFDALARTRMNEGAVLDYISKVESVERAIALRKRNLEEKAQSRKGREKMSERERALLEHGVRAWVREILTLPEGYEYDPGVAWDELGIDMLVIDEAAAFKNLHMPQAREDGVPKFMGGGGEGSDRAWQVDFRAAAVRKNTGGAGIVLLTATPAKNSPLEFYNLIQFIDPSAFTSAGIHDPEQFIDRFLKIEYREVLDSAFDVTMKPAVTGFKNLDDLRTIIFTYGEFRTAAEVNLELPKAVVETITIAMDEEQERRYRKYVAQIEYILENPSPDGPSNIILGLLARLSLVALHASLEDGYTYATALNGGIVKKKVTNADGSAELVELRLSKPTYESPKLVECAKRVAASAHCGHIIFCEPTTVHLWMREVLVSHGVPRERIAILNAEETAPADRIRIAREFNGLSSEAPAPGTCTRPTDSKTAPKYDVIIANSVAYEGVDLQVRTCTIHHLDLPWTPADLEQRNGRAVRQGNTLGTVQIYYYFADGSTDGYRFSLIDGKATWLADLIKTQARDTNNPAAQQQLTPEDILLMISRDKAKTKKLLEDKKARQIAEARVKIAKESARLLRQAAGRFADARRSTDPERAAKLREEGEQRLADLERMDPEAWLWAPWMYAVRDRDVLIPENGGAPVYEGLRIAKPRAGHTDQFEHLEFGRVTSDEHGDTIGLRAAGSPSWQVIAYKDGLLGGAPLLPEHFPREGSPAWPADDDVITGEAIEKKIESSLRYGKFENLGWRAAADTWIERWWPRFADTIADKMASAYARETVPVVLDGKLVLATGETLREGTLLPHTRAGWQRFLELAPSSGLAFAALREAGQHWWGRKIPQNLLSKDRDAREAAEKDAETNSEAAGRGASRTHADVQVLSPEATRRFQEFVDSSSPATGTDEEIDQRVLDNIFLQHAAVGDAMAMAGISRQDRKQQAEAFQRDVATFAVLRGAQFLWRVAGYGADLMGGPGRANLVISKDGVFLAAQQASSKSPQQYPFAVSHELAPEAHGAIADTLEKHLDTILGIARRELAGGVTEDSIRALWRAARQAGHETPQPPTSPPHPSSPLPVTAPPPATPVTPPSSSPSVTPPTLAEAAPEAALDVAEAERLREGRRQLYHRALARKFSALEWPAGDDLDKAARMFADKIIALEEDFWRDTTPGEDQSVWDGRVEELEESLRDMFEKSDEIASADLIASLTDATDFLDFVRELIISRGADILPEFPRENGQPVPDPQALVARGIFDAGVPESFDLFDTAYELRAHETVFDGPALTLVYRAERPPRAAARPTLRVQIIRTGAQTYHARGELRNVNDRRTHAFSQSDVALGFLRELSSKRLAALLRPVRAKEPTSNPNKRPAPALEQARIRPLDGVQEIVRLFNQSPDDPRLRLERTRGRGFVLVAYNADAPDDAVASIDLSPGFTIEDVRWLMYENRPAQQSTILARLHRAIEAVKNALRVGPEPSELAPLLDQLRVRVAKLGGRDRRGGQPGWRELWELVRDSAEPPSPTPREVMAWLDEQHLYDLAAELGAYLYSPERPQVEFFEDFRAKLDKFYPRWRVAGSAKSESLSVAAHAVRGEEPDHYLVKDSTLGPARVNIELLPPEPGKPNQARFRLRTGTLHPGDQVYDAEVDERIAAELRARIDALETALKKTPTFLEDARQLLHLAGQLLNAPLCEGSTRDDALAAFNQAYAVYDDARRQVIEGRSARALEQIRQVAVHVATAAAKVAESCAEGQVSIAAPTIAAPAVLAAPEDGPRPSTSRQVSARRLRTLNARGFGRDTVARMLSELRARGAFAERPEGQPMTIAHVLERAELPVSNACIQRLGDLAILAFTDPQQLDRARDVLMSAGFRPRTRDGRLIVRERTSETSP